jgi:hypothetical protein
VAATDNECNFCLNLVVMCNAALFQQHEFYEFISPNEVMLGLKPPSPFPGTATVCNTSISGNLM